jgi:hypothetical protein
MNPTPEQPAVDTVTLEEFCTNRRVKRRASKFTLSSRGSSNPNLGDVFEFNDLQDAVSFIILHPSLVSQEQNAPEQWDSENGLLTGSKISTMMHRRVRRSSVGPLSQMAPAPAGVDLEGMNGVNGMNGTGAPSAGLAFDEMEKTLHTADHWQWDAFRLAEVTNGYPLSALGYYLFHSNDLISRFNIKPIVLARFLRRIEEGYKTNPYHNSIHASDVLQTMHVMMHRGGLAPGYVDPLTMMAAYTAAIVHDFEHLGLTNDYLINSADMLAIR